MKFGLDDHIIEMITHILEEQPKLDKAYIFGSRAKGNYRPDSDIDIAVKGYDLTMEDILKMSAGIDKLGIGYEVDMMDYDCIKEVAMKEHVDRVGMEIYSRWKKYTLGSLCTDIDYGYTASASDIPKGPKFLRITDIVPPQVNWKSVPYCKIDDHNHSKYRLHKGDIVIARTGATTGFNYTFNEKIDSVFASYLIRYKIDKNKADPFFIGHVLKSESWKGFVEGIIGGSAQPGANAKMFAAFEINLPPLYEQSLIAKSLSILDEKIDLLHRQNKTLESIAETLFRQWFVEESDPNWEYQRLGNYVQIKRGGSPRPIHDYISNEGYNWLKISDVSDVQSPYISEIKEKIRPEGLNKTVLLKRGALILSNSATPGIPKILDVDSCIHDGWLYFSRSKFSNEFLYLLFRYIRPELLQRGNGSIFTNLKTDILKEYVIPIAEEGTLIKFDFRVKPIFKKLYLNTNQIRILNKLRDELRPKLLSGEARVKPS
jgi:type I restriction enzyme, S subunit